MKMKHPSHTKTGHSRKAAITGLVIFLAISFAPALFGSQFKPDAWYQGLVKPALTPPGWVFGPVWTVLYAAMGVSAWLVWRQKDRVPVQGALFLFGIQLVLNGIWTYLFFGLKNPGLAFVEILVLWVAIACTVISFRQKSRTAALILIPYLAWVSFAAYLNFELWRLNPTAALGLPY